MAVLTEEPISFGMAVTECMGTPILASLTGIRPGTDPVTAIRCRKVQDS